MEYQTKTQNAHNVVSMGEMDSTQDLYSFWPSFSDVDGLYALEGTNNNCPGVKLFHSTENGFYQLEGSTEYVGDLLSNSATERDYGMVWTRELDLGYLLMVSIGKPINTNMTMLHGYTIKEVIEKMNVDISGFFLVDRMTNKEINMDDIASHDIDIALCFNVSFQSLAEIISYLIEYETTIEQNKGPLKLPANCHLIPSGSTEEVAFDIAIITNNTVFIMHHKIIVTGTIQATLFVVHGIILEDVTKLPRYFELSERYEVRDENDPLFLLSRKKVIDDDLNITITEYHDKSNTPVIAASVACDHNCFHEKEEKQ